MRPNELPGIDRWSGEIAELWIGDEHFNGVSWSFEKGGSGDLHRWHATVQICDAGILRHAHATFRCTFLTDDRTWRWTGHAVVEEWGGPTATDACWDQLVIGVSDLTPSAYASPAHRDDD
jgi:hypothetical protein